MQIKQTEVLIATPDGQMPAVLLIPNNPDHKPAILLLMEAFGLTSHILRLQSGLQTKDMWYLSRISTMVADEWIDAVKDITVPIYLFFGCQDPFISGDRIQQIHARFQELGKDYSLKVYPEAGHGFFCNERAD